MSARPCAVEWGLMSRDREEAEAERREAEEAPKATLADVRRSVLEALESGSEDHPVLCVDRKTDRQSKESIGEAMSVLWDEKLSALVAKLLATKTPEALEAREYIAAQHVRFCEGVL